jgi:hypothetical protein
MPVRSDIDAIHPSICLSRSTQNIFILHVSNERVEEEKEVMREEEFFFFRRTRGRRGGQCSKIEHMSLVSDDTRKLATL